MPDQKTLDRAREDAREGKSPSTQAGEFVKEEIDHVREGKHGVANTKQAIAIGLSKARRAGVKLPPPQGSESVRKKAAEDSKAAKRKGPVSSKRSQAVSGALKREPHSAASSQALSRHAKTAAARRGKQNRSKAAVKAAKTRRAA